MMTKPNSSFTALKKIMTLPIFALFALLFVQKVYATTSKNNQNLTKFPLKATKAELIIQPKSSEKFKSIEKSDKTTSNVSDETPSLKKLQKVESSNLEISEKSLKVDTIKTPAEFLGGVNDFRRKIAEKFDTSKINPDSGNLKTNVQFSVDEQGNISNVHAIGANTAFNEEAIKTVSFVTENIQMTPAKIDGTAVKSVYNLPLTMKFSK